MGIISFSTSIISISLFIFSCLRFFLLHVLFNFTDFAVPWLSCNRIFFGFDSSGIQSSRFSFLDDPQSSRGLFSGVIALPDLGLPLCPGRQWGFYAREGGPILPPIGAWTKLVQIVVFHIPVFLLGVDSIELNSISLDDAWPLTL